MGGPAVAPGADTRVEWSFLDRITAVAQRRWPPLLEARAKTAWAGLYENTPDFQPLIGPPQPGRWTAGGFFADGVLVAPGVGKWLSAWIALHTPEHSRLSF